MKKICSLFVIFSLILSINAYAYTDRTVIPEGTYAKFEPFFENYNVTRYTPWFKHYHMETQEDYNNGVYGGEGGQEIMAISISPVNPDNMILGTDTSGAWVSTNGGNVWRQIGEGAYTWAVPDVQWHKNYERTVYMAQTNCRPTDGTLNALKSKAPNTDLDGIWRSNDAGKTWKQVLNHEIYCNNQSENLIQFDNYNNVYALTSKGLYKSTDDGDTFVCLGKVVYDTDSTKPFFTADYENYTAVEDEYIGGIYVSDDGNTIAVCAYSGLNVSEDGGKTWTKASGALGTGTAYSVCVDPADSNHFAITTTAGSKLYQTYDKFKTFEAVSFSKITSSKELNPGFVKLTRDSNNKLRMFVGFTNNGIRYTDNNGTTWVNPTLNPNNRFTPSYKSFTCEGFAVCESIPGYLATSMGDIVYVSNDNGTTWNIKNSGYSANYVRQFFFDGDNRLWFSFTDKGLGVTDTPYDGETLPVAHMTDTKGSSHSITIDPNNKNHMFTALGDWYVATLKVSYDEGASWQDVAGTDSNVPWFVFKYDNENKNKIYASCYTSNDNGKTWTANNRQIMGISNVDTNVQYSFENGKKVISRTSDAGKTWSDVTVKYPISCVTPDEFDKNVVWIGTNCGNVVKVTYGNSVVQTVMSALNGIPDGGNYGEQKLQILQIAQDPKNKNHLVFGGKCTYAGINSPGILETVDGGKNWYVVPGSRGPMTINSLAFSPVSNELFIGTCSNGTIVYEFDKYRNENTINIDVDTDIAQGISTQRGKFGEGYTLPTPVIKDNNYYFAGYELDDDYEYLNGQYEKVNKVYQPNETINFSYKDIYLKAIFKQKNIEFIDKEEEFETDNKLDELCIEENGKITAYYNYKSPDFKLNYLGEHSLSGNKAYAFYNVDLSYGTRLKDSRLTIDILNTYKSGNLKIYGVSDGFDNVAGIKNPDKPYSAESISVNKTLLDSEKITKYYSGKVTFDISDFAKECMNNGKSSCTVLLCYEMDEKFSFDQGIAYANKEWDNNAVCVKSTYYDIIPATVETNSIKVRANTFNYDCSFIPVVGVYEKANPNKLVSVKYLDYVDATGGDAEFCFDKEGIDNEKYFVKVFGFENLNSIKPLISNGVIKQ